MDLTTRIVFIVLTTLIAVGIGLLARRMLVKRLKSTILDNWIIQTLGVIIVFIPLIIAAPITLAFWDNNILAPLWTKFTSQISLQEVTGTATNLLETTLIIVLGIGTARTLMKLAIRGIGENRVDINIRTLIGRLGYILVIVIAAFWLLSLWQIPIGIPAAALGIVTVAVAFSVQEILKDLVAGFYILVERPFHIGDQISTANYTGKVEDVQIRATKMRLVSGEEVTIPNSMLFSGIVINNSFYGERRATITVTLAMSEFAEDETPKKIISVLAEIETILAKPEATVIFSGYIEDKVTLTLRFWIARGQHSAITEAMQKLHKLLPNAALAVVDPAGDI